MCLVNYLSLINLKFWDTPVVQGGRPAKSSAILKGNGLIGQGLRSLSVPQESWFFKTHFEEREEKKHFNAAISKYVLYRHMQCLISRLICDAQNNHLEVASTLNQRTRKPQTNHNSHLIKKKKKKKPQLSQPRNGQLPLTTCYFDP